jgi:hypothetical protein
VKIGIFPGKSIEKAFYLEIPRTILLSFRGKKIHSKSQCYDRELQLHEYPSAIWKQIIIFYIGTLKKRFSLGRPAL